MASTLTFDAPLDPMLQRRREIQAVAAATLRRRKNYSRIAVGVCWVFLGIAIVPLVAVVAYVVIKGLPAWNADFFTHPTTPEGIPGGGVANAIVGTAEIGLIATAVTVPLGLTCGLFLASSDGRVASAVRFVADVMTGVPSITIGIFGYIAIVKNFGYSGLAGAFAIGIVMLPVIIRAGETAYRGVPYSLNEAALALGARNSTIARRVVVPSAMPGVITGVLLAVARGLGETAPLLLTIFGNQYMQWNPTKPMDALPLVIFNNSSQPYADLVQIAWGAALLLMVVVLALSIGSRVAAAFLQKEKR
ncbi:MAG: phosphate ABC transporter permease PstA [Acidimicrobiales bacterium]|jgi:phosphate transport system permease protein